MSDRPKRGDMQTDADGSRWIVTKTERVGLHVYTVRRYGLTKTDPTGALREGGWRQVWAHPSGLFAARNPATGRWHVTDGRTMDGSFSSSLRAAARKIERAQP